MLSENAHLSEHDLVLAADGELPSRRRAEVTAHLESCWSCRERMSALQGAITSFVRARNDELKERIPSPAGPRALLQARMAEGAEISPRANSIRARFVSFLSRGISLQRLEIAGAAFGALVLAVLVAIGSTASAEGFKPKSGITPGEARPITLDEVCLYSRAEISREIPEDMRRKVFAEYGIKAPRADQFEVDYLITPDLGGAESIRNLWPQPYSARWNARVKDKLEQRLHELVCERKLDLATAQHDIAVDWVTAYKKYVGEDSAR